MVVVGGQLCGTLMWFFILAKCFMSNARRGEVEVTFKITSRGSAADECKSCLHCHPMPSTPTPPPPPIAVPQWGRPPGQFPAAGGSSGLQPYAFSAHAMAAKAPYSRTSLSWLSLVRTSLPFVPIPLHFSSGFTLLSGLPAAPAGHHPLLPHPDLQVRPTPLGRPRNLCPALRQGLQTRGSSAATYTAI